MTGGIREVTGHPVRVICATPGAPRSSCCHAAAPTAMQRSGGETGLVIEAIFREHRGRCGYRRIHGELGGFQLEYYPKFLSKNEMTCSEFCKMF